MPTRIKINIHNYVDDAAEAGLDLVRAFADVDTHPRVLDRNAHEVTPAAYPCRRLGVVLGTLREQHPSKHAYPCCRAVAGVWNHLGDVARIPRASSTPALHRMIDSNSAVRGRLRHIGTLATTLLGSLARSPHPALPYGSLPPTLVWLGQGRATRRRCGAAPRSGVPRRR